MTEATANKRDEDFDSSVDNFHMKPARKKKVFQSASDKMRLFLEYKRLAAGNGVDFPTVSDTELWRQAQEIFPEDRRISENAFVARRLEYKKLLESGGLNVKPEPHDHRPAAERGFVPIAPAAEPPKPVTVDPVTATPPAVSVPSHPVGPLEQAITDIVRHVVKTELVPQIHGIVSQMMDQVDSRLNEQYLRLLAYWDPDLAEHARKENLDLPSITGAIGPSQVQTPSVPVQAKTSVPAAAAPEIEKKRVLICGGKEDGFWSYLQDSLPSNIIVKFCDGHKPRSIPTGKHFDLVLVHWMTSHPARAVIKTYYPDHQMMMKGSTTRLVSIIKQQLSL